MSHAFSASAITVGVAPSRHLAFERNDEEMAERRSPAPSVGPPIPSPEPDDSSSSAIEGSVRDTALFDREGETDLRYQPRIHWPAFFREGLLTALPPLIGPMLAYCYDGMAGWRNRHFWGFHLVTFGQAVMGAALYWSLINFLLLPEELAAEVGIDVMIAAGFVVTRIVMVGLKWGLRPVDELERLSTIVVPEPELRAVELAFGWNSLAADIVERECDRTASFLKLNVNARMHLVGYRRDVMTAKQMVKDHFEYACRTLGLEKPQVLPDGSLLVSVKTWVCSVVLSCAPRRLPRRERRKNRILREGMKVLGAMLLSFLPAIYRAIVGRQLTSSQWAVAGVAQVTTFMIAYNFVFAIMFAARDDYARRYLWVKAASDLLQPAEYGKLSLDLTEQPHDLIYFIQARKWLFNFGLQFQQRVQWWLSTLFLICIGLTVRSLVIREGAGVLVVMAAYTMYVLTLFIGSVLVIGFRIHQSAEFDKYTLAVLKMRAHQQHRRREKVVEHESWEVRERLFHLLTQQLHLVDDVMHALELETTMRPLKVLGAPLGPTTVRAVASILGSGVVSATRALL